ncbi:ABC transporter ATP-binding protein [Pseudomonas oryzihabitans]|uniref:ABC transporter ATP-binding protein n=1 Tax=Pseudomonas oryzihabitans TaxID=47885 RepID=UPI0011A991B7|nr:ABC transporter ATP-binding protein [Pseudomonas psychrotolerans]
MSRAQPPGPLLEVRDISLSFKGVKALDRLSFRVAQGEICALIGPNGAGKSSLLNILNGVYRPDVGEVVFAGQRWRQVHPLAAARQGIGRTFQNNALFKRMSVSDNLLTGLSRHGRATLLEQALGLPRARREASRFQARAEEILELLELQPWRETAVGTLAYGLQKRVELGRALIAGPRLLLLDEPMAGMNSEEKQAMSRFIAEANRELGSTVVLIEHDIGVVMDLASHVVVLDYGRKVGDGTPAEVRANPDVIAAYLGSAEETAA